MAALARNENSVAWQQLLPASLLISHAFPASCLVPVRHQLHGRTVGISVDKPAHHQASSLLPLHALHAAHAHTYRAYFTILPPAHRTLHTAAYAPRARTFLPRCSALVRGPMCRTLPAPLGFGQTGDAFCNQRKCITKRGSGGLCRTLCACTLRAHALRTSAPRYARTWDGDHNQFSPCREDSTPTCMPPLPPPHPSTSLPTCLPLHTQKNTLHYFNCTIYFSLPTLWHCLSPGQTYPFCHSRTLHTTHATFTNSACTPLQHYSSPLSPAIPMAFTAYPAHACCNGRTTCSPRNTFSCGSYVSGMCGGAGLCLRSISCGGGR